MNIYQKLIEVRKTVDYLQKENAGPQYAYVSSSQALSAVRSKMNELSLLLIPEVVSHNILTDTVEFTDQYGKPKRTTTFFTELDIKYKWVDGEKPEDIIEVMWYGQGVDIAGEKGVGKALTYAEKYFILKSFNIPTDKDDPDAHQKKTDPEGPKKQEHLSLTDYRNQVNTAMAQMGWTKDEDGGKAKFKNFRLSIFPEKKNLTDLNREDWQKLAGEIQKQVEAIHNIKAKEEPKKACCKCGVTEGEISKLGEDYYCVDCMMGTGSETNV